MGATVGDRLDLTKVDEALEAWRQAAWVPRCTVDVAARGFAHAPRSASSASLVCSSTANGSPALVPRPPPVHPPNLSSDRSPQRSSRARLPWLIDGYLDSSTSGSGAR
jgi:hypothetical protein